MNRQVGLEFRWKEQQITASASLSTYATPATMELKCIAINRRKYGPALQTAKLAMTSESLDLHRALSQAPPSRLECCGTEYI